MVNLSIEHLKPGRPLALKNEGNLEVFFIGVGSAFALRHFQTNFFLIKGDTHILVDFGMTGPQALAAVAGLKAGDVEVILPTHSHGDHVNGIECIALTNRYIGIPFAHKEKTVCVITEEYQRILWDSTLRGALERNERPEGKRILTFSDYFDVIRPKWKANQPREIFEVDIGSIHLELFRTKHIPQESENWEASFVSYGLFVDNKIFISGDTRFDIDLINLYAPKADYIFHDVQFFPLGVHAPLADLKNLPSAIKEKMRLIHYSDDWEMQDISGFVGWARQGLRYIFK